MTALQTLPATTTSTTEIDRSHHAGRGIDYEQQQRPLSDMEHAHGEQEAVTMAAAAGGPTSEGSKDYATLGTTLAHLQRTGEIATADGRGDAVDQGRPNVEENAQVTVLDRRKEPDDADPQEAANEVHDAALPPQTDGPADIMPANNRKRKYSPAEGPDAHAQGTSPPTKVRIISPSPHTENTSQSTTLPLPSSPPSSAPSSHPHPSAPQPALPHPDLTLIPPQSPLPSILQSDLLSLFSLQPLVSSVARTDPLTGEKINKMRKSYEGHVKSFVLGGRNRAVKYEPEKFSSLYKGRPPMRLIDMAKWPEEEWTNQQVHGKDVKHGLRADAMAKLGQAMEFIPGKVTDHEKWEELLGMEKPKAVSATPTTSSLKNCAMLPNGKTNGPARSAIRQGTMTSDAARPRRANKKRRYDDGSFEGYGEGFLDDDLDSERGFISGAGGGGGIGGGFGSGGGYSSTEGESRRASMQHKKRKMGSFG